MGTTPSKLQPGAKLQVIGAGLPRTGTASFAAALEILLKGPVFHAGIQHTLTPSEIPLRRAMALLSHAPKRHTSPTSERAVLDILRSIFDEGYTAVADAPYFHFTPELLTLYSSPTTRFPIVICTTRSPTSWTRSLAHLSAAGKTATGWKTYLVPVARLFPQYIKLFRDAQLFPPPGSRATSGEEIYEAHIEWLKSVVPEEKLIFYDVRDGWGPLCEALDVPVPVGVEFPRVNDGEHIDRIARDFVRRGLMRWAMVVSVLVAVLGIAVRVWLFS